MKNIILITRGIPKWRVPFYQKLLDNKNYQFFIYYSGKKSKLISSNRLIHLNSKTFSGNFVVQDISTIKFSAAHAIILIFDLHFINFIKIWVLYRKKILWWGIGFGHSFLGNLFRSFLVYSSKGLLSYTKDVHSSVFYRYISKRKLHALNNTIENTYHENIFNVDSNKIILIGTMDTRKRYDIVFKAIPAIKQKYNIQIHLIGDGQEYTNLKNLANSLNINDKVFFHGRVENENEIKKIVKGALLVVSPGQAGLSIMHAFSYGLPFVTYKNSITGGERSHIENNWNGLLLKNLEVAELSEKLIWCFNNKEELHRMSGNAYQYYLNNDINNMVAKLLPSLE